LLLAFFHVLGVPVTTRFARFRVRHRPIISLGKLMSARGEASVRHVSC
jgi:hypothetical protein